MNRTILTLLSFSLLSASFAHAGNAAKQNTLSQSSEGANRIVAIVNDNIISSKDVTDRTALVIATTGLQNSDEIEKKLSAQIIRGLIDEQLQIQAAKKLNLSVSSAEIQQAIAGIEQNRNKPAGSLKSFLKTRGVSPVAFEEQIKAQILWNKLISKKIAPSIAISDNEVRTEQERVSRLDTKKVQYQLASILLPVMRPEDSAPTQKLAEKLITEIKAGANFEAIANQLSAAGGKQSSPQWVASEQLNPHLKQALEQMGDKGVSSPIKTPSGYQIIQLLNKKSMNLAADVDVTLKQLILSLKEDAKSKEVDVLMEIARSIAKNPGTCEEKTVAGIDSFEGLNIDVNQLHLKLSEMSPSMRPFVEPLKVGGISEPFAAPDGIHLLMLCERSELPIAGSNKDQAKERIFSDKLQVETMKYLRDLRRAAYIDIRNK